MWFKPEPQSLHVRFYVPFQCFLRGFRLCSYESTCTVDPPYNLKRKKKCRNLNDSDAEKKSADDRRIPLQTGRVSTTFIAVPAEPGLQKYSTGFTNVSKRCTLLALFTTFFYSLYSQSRSN